MCMLPEKVKTIVKGSARRGEEIFIIFRDYVKHEDMLINQRMTWMITIQSFLIATFGFSYQKKIEIISKVFTDDNLSPQNIVGLMRVIQTFNVFLLIICGIGIVMSMITSSLLEAARLAISGLEKKWNETSKLHETEQLPKLTGGSHDDMKAKQSGEKLSKRITLFFIGFWASLILFMLVDISLNLQIK
jgi:hypothetical protein